MTCRLGNLLRRRGVKRGDCVTIYMPPCPMAVASMLACARIGAAHNVVFAGFSAEALSERIRDGETASLCHTLMAKIQPCVVLHVKAVDITPKLSVRARYFQPDPAL